MNWTPTNELRWFKPQPYGGSYGKAFERSVLGTNEIDRWVLQQKWVREFIYQDEDKERETPREDWRDIPTVTEE